MPKSHSYGQIIQERAKLLVKSLFDCAKENRSAEWNILKCRWNSSKNTIEIETELRCLIVLLDRKVQKGKIDELLRHHLSDEFLGICHKPSQQGKALQCFTLQLWSDRWEENEREFDRLWANKKAAKQKKLTPSNEASITTATTKWQEICTQQLDTLKSLLSMLS